MNIKNVKSFLAAVAITFSAPFAAVAGTIVDGVNVERKVNSWLGLIDSAKYDEAGEWLASRGSLLAEYTLSANALRALHAEHGPTRSRLLFATEIEPGSFDRVFEVTAETTFINNGTAEEVVRIGVLNGQWSILDYEVGSSGQ